MRALAVLLAGFLLTFFYGFHSTRTGLLGPDEPRYAAIGLAMAESGDWITPRLWGAAWFEKPPLTYWLVAAGHRAGLPGEAAARGPIALYSASALVASVLLLIPLTGLPAALSFGVLLATSAGWLAFSHLGATDLPLAASFLLAMLLTLRGLASGRQRFLNAAGVFFGLAVLAKGLVPLVLALPVAWFARRHWRLFLLPVCLGILVAAPWYAAMTALHGRAFLADLFVKHHFQRFSSDAIQHVQPWWFYLPVALCGLFPWTPLLALLRRSTFDSLPARFAGAWFVWGFLFFSLSANKLPGYLLPLMPALCLILALALALAWSRASQALPLAAAVLLLALVPPVAAVLPAALLDGLSGSPWRAAGWSGLLWAAPLAVSCAWLARRRPAHALALAALVCAGATAWLKVSVYPALDRIASARPLAVSNAICPENLPRSLLYGFNYYKRSAACPEP